MITISKMSNASHDRPRHRAELADRQPGPVVHAVDRIAGELLEQTLLDHHAPAALVLLGRLEDEVYGAVEGARLGEILRRAEQHGGVPVVAARVHLAVVVGAMREGVLLADMERVEIGAQADRALAAARAQRADDAGLREPAVHLDAERGEHAGHYVRGAVLLERGFGMSVDVAPPGGHLALQFADAVDDRHDRDDIIATPAVRLRSSFMRQYIQGIDHVVVVVRDLDAARDNFARMGFAVTPRGHHTLGSQNHCVMFGHDYIELLMSPEGNPHPSRQYYTEFARTGEGLAGVALKSASAKGAYTELLWAGFQPSDPMEFSRPVAAPEGARDARFRVTQPKPGSTPGGRTFVCEHMTRDLVWRPEYRRHANGATGLAAIAIVCEDPVRTAKPYERLFDAKSKPIAEGVLVETGDTPLAFVTAQSLAKRLPNVWISARPVPLMAVLFVRVADREAAAAALAAGGLEPARMPDGSVAVGADAAHGVALVFG